MAVIHTVELARTPKLCKVKIRNGKPVYENVIFNENKVEDKIFTRQLGIFMAETCARYMNPYVPMDTGVLSGSYISEPYKVTYTAPYARKMFYGEGFNFSKEKHPLATARWDKATQDAKSREIAREVSKYIKMFGGSNNG